MTIKDILVHIDTAPACEARLSLTIRLARRFDARITGLLILPSPETLALPDSGMAAVALATYLADLKKAAATAGDNFLATVRGHGLEAAWKAEVGPAVRRFTRRARAVDLVILGQRDPDHPTELTAPEDVILACGRPVLVVPYAGRFDDAGARVLIAWNGSREAARAVQEALPLMTIADAVTLLAAKPKGPADEDLSPEVARHLARHGFNPRVEPTIARDAGIGDEILSRAADLSADLIVMGAYGHSRFRESILGGATRAILRQMTLPVLMAH
jgi:nucleotide-binding universal stress UspA family protein